MPRIQYSFPSAEVARQISDRRGGNLTPLDLLLSHNDRLAHGWNVLLGAVRTGFHLSGELRELVILRIGRLNAAAYEWDAHLPLARREGLPEDVIEALLSDAPATGHQPHDAVLRYVDEMTRDVKVSDAAFDALREHFDDTRIAEITATAAAYNMVSRFLVALEVKTTDRDGTLPASAPTPA
jgi:4-carboxymuconolactone decarboxylase